MQASMVRTGLRADRWAGKVFLFHTLSIRRCPLKTPLSLCPLPTVFYIDPTTVRS